MLWLFYNINSGSNQYTHHNEMHPTKKRTFIGNPVLPVNFSKPHCTPFCKQHLHSRSMIYNNSRYKMKRNNAIRMTEIHTANNTKFAPLFSCPYIWWFRKYHVVSLFHARPLPPMSQCMTSLIICNHG